METHSRHHGIIKREQVRLEESDARRRRAPGPRAPSSSDAPRVRLVDLDERTQAFEFTCSCGEVSLIEVQYEDKP